MDWGMSNRMSQLIQSDGHCVFLPIDHGYFLGPTRKLEQPGKTVEPLMPYADALFVTRGVLRSAIDPANTKPVVLRVSGGTSMVGGDLANEGITTSIEEGHSAECVRPGHLHFRRQRLREAVSLEPGQAGGRGREIRYPGHGCHRRRERVGKARLAIPGPVLPHSRRVGRQVVKTYWSDDGFDRVVDGCPVPVIMAGGPQLDTEIEVLDFVHDGMQNGSIGINLGRNIWQSEYPVPMIRALRHIVHGNGSVKEAQEIFETAKAEGGILAGVSD